MTDKHAKNSIGKNVFHLFFGTTLSRVLNALTLIILAHDLAASDYGMFSVALAFAMVVGYFTDAGLSNTVLREGSKETADVQAVLSSYIRLRIILLAGTLFISAFCFHTLFKDVQLLQMMYCLVIPMVFGLAMQSIGVVYFQLREQMQYVGAIRIWSSVFLVLTVSIGMLADVSPYTIAFLFGFSYLLAGIYALYMVNKSTTLSIRAPFQKSLLENVSSFIISGLLMMLLPQLGPLLLEHTLTLAQIGLFAVAFRIPSALYQIPGIIAGAFYPVLFARHHQNEPEQHLQLHILQIKMMAILSTLIVIPLFHMSEWMVGLLFGERWLPAAGLLKILSLLLMFQGMNIALADGLTTKGLQMRRTVMQGIAVLLAVVLYVLLSSRFSVAGAAYAAVSIEFISLLGFWALNPSRWIIAKRVLLLYSLFCLASLVSINFFLSSFPLVAVFVHTLCVISLIMMDHELRQKGISLLQSKRKNGERRVRGIS